MNARRWLRGATALVAVVMFAAPSAMAPAAADPSGTVFISTVPALGGVHLTVAGAAATTAADGTVSLALADIRNAANHVRLASDQIAPGTRVSLGKVVPGPHVSRESHLKVGLDVTSTVGLSIDSGTTGVDASKVKVVHLHSSLGERLKIDPRRTKTVKLLSRRTSLVHGVLTTRRVTWSVDLVSVGPGVALTTSTPRFDPFGSSSWQLHLKTLHGTVVIQTVPRTTGVVFQLEGATVTTGPRGRALAPVSDLNNVSDQLTLASSAAGNLHVSDLRVSKLPPKALRQRRLVAALVVRRPVAFRFTDLGGQLIPASHISQMRITADSASVKLVGKELGTPSLLLTRIATRIGSYWHERPITYQLRSVRIDGSEAVFDGRQRFTPGASGVWTVSLAVFSLSVTAHDAIFGNQVNSTAVITKPDGAHYAVALRSGSPSIVPSMVRGLYGLQIDSAVLGGHTTLLVSRDDTLDLRVVTFLDALIVAILGTFILVAAVLGGRLMARRRGAAPRAGT